MKKFLLLLLSFILFSTPAFAQDCEDCTQQARMFQAVIGGGVTAAVSNGTVGYPYNASNTGGFIILNGTAWFSPATVGVGSGGTVRYGHLYLHDYANTTDVICLSLQQNSDGGTVYLSAAGNPPTNDGGWINIDMGSNYTIVEGTTYRLVVQSSTNTWVIESNLGAGVNTSTDTMAYSCGGSVTIDATGQTDRVMFIIFNNTAGNPS